MCDFQIKPGPEEFISCKKAIIKFENDRNEELEFNVRVRDNEIMAAWFGENEPEVDTDPLGGVDNTLRDMLFPKESKKRKRYLNPSGCLLRECRSYIKNRLPRNRIHSEPVASSHERLPAERYHRSESLPAGASANKALPFTDAGLTASFHSQSQSYSQSDWFSLSQCLTMSGSVFQSQATVEPASSLGSQFLISPLNSQRDNEGSQLSFRTPMASSQVGSMTNGTYSRMHSQITLTNSVMQTDAEGVTCSPELPQWNNAQQEIEALRHECLKLKRKNQILEKKYQEIALQLKTERAIEKSRRGALSDREKAIKQQEEKMVERMRKADSLLAEAREKLARFKVKEAGLRDMETESLIKLQNDKSAILRRIQTSAVTFRQTLIDELGEVRSALAPLMELEKLKGKGDFSVFLFAASLAEVDFDCFKKLEEQITLLEQKQRASERVLQLQHL
ncbi:hypothetical protein D5018_05610 [Parashewanella curva]|uniref:Uncharacterized protein n=2 Tax=Parashewanella curva TaxID=2338552 RepID=A0A3L8Q009_9GAMM|nr:hypothetical protein D5018_05610 [Parashewanella curva]